MRWFLIQTIIKTCMRQPCLESYNQMGWQFVRIQIDIRDKTVEKQMIGSKSTFCCQHFQNRLNSHCF